jgi:formylglycine-generating enzyme required for sulfatase activity
MIKMSITIKAFAVLVLSAVIATPSLAQNKKDSSVATGLRPNQTFRDCPECPEMVVIPSGSFMMGSPADEPGRFDTEGPERRVSIKQFAVGKFNITKAQWAAFVLATNRITSPGCAWSGFDNKDRKDWDNDPTANWNHLGFPQDSTHPVVCITWYDAQDYVQWLGKKTGSNYRLLTEAEWEYAARGGTTTPYPWGSSITHEYANYGLDSGGYSGLASGRDRWLKTSPVGSFPPNAFGLYDMNGNVWQWVEDYFSSSYSGLPTDGSAFKDTVQIKMEGRMSWMNEKKSSFFRMVRGGDWANPPRMIRSAYRNIAPGPGGFTLENYRSGGGGFRVAKTL